MAKEWAKAFYASKAWEDCRLAYLISRDYLCERCGAAAEIVHHKIYLTPENISDPAIALGADNLEALCQDCHNKEHHCEDDDTPRYFFDDAGNLIPVLPPFSDD